MLVEAVEIQIALVERAGEVVTKPGSFRACLAAPIIALSTAINSDRTVGGPIFLPSERWHRTQEDSQSGLAYGRTQRPRASQAAGSGWRSPGGPQRLHH